MTNEIYEVFKLSTFLRIKDIAERRNAKLSTVSTALEKGLINYQYGYISLTEEGLEIEEKKENKKQILCNFLTQILKVNPETGIRDGSYN